MGNKVKAAFMSLYLITILSIKYRIKAHKKFRVVQTAYNSFELQKYGTMQYASRNGLTGGIRYEWLPILTGTEKNVSNVVDINKDVFKTQCRLHRESEFHGLINEYEEKIRLVKELNYPKVIY